LNVHRVSIARQIEIYSVQPPISEPRPFEVEIDNAKLKRYKSPGSDQIPAEPIQARDEILRSEIHKLIRYILNKEELPDQWKESIIVPDHKNGDKTDCTNYGGISLLLTSYKILSNIFLSSLSPHTDKVLGIISVRFDLIDQLLITAFAFVR
jgi:hypothetical protein